MFGCVLTPGGSRGNAYCEQMMNQQQNPAFTLINVTLLQMWLTLLTPRPLRPAVLLLIRLACGQKSVRGG